MEELAATGDALDAAVVTDNAPTEHDERAELEAHLDAAERKVEKQKAHLAAAEAEVEAAKDALARHEGGA